MSLYDSGIRRPKTIHRRECRSETGKDSGCVQRRGSKFLSVTRPKRFSESQAWFIGLGPCSRDGGQLISSQSTYLSPESYSTCPFCLSTDKVFAHWPWGA